MCGIAGEVTFNGEAADGGLVLAMASTMVPRGPDSGGLFQQGRVAFGHRRLRIIDLSEKAQQPLVDADLGLAIVFNGCIYNHHELRAELQAKGYSFFSTGDTEVILKAYHAWGRDCVKHFHGMFAFCIHERDSGRVMLGRDRLGIKPLYLAETPGKLRFASSLPALLKASDVDRTIDAEALHHYMMWHAVVPPPLTIIKGVRKLPPATTRVIERDGTVSDETYWSLNMVPTDEDARLSETEWMDRLLEALRLAVKRRLVADVPVGVLLSGGVDSSLIVGLLAEAGQGAAGLNTFSVGFDAAGGEAGDEFQYSDLIAKHFGTTHHKFRVGASETIENLPATIFAQSEPMVSHDNVGFYLLSREVSKHVKVVQSGQGADEVFGGYHWYPPLANSTNPVSDYAQVFFDRSQAELAKTLNPDYLASSNVSRAFVEKHFGAEGAPKAVDKALRLDTTVMLVDDPVKRVDNMTMAWGLEARVPFLDHELVELAGRIPAELKIRGEGKWILKEVSRRVIPSEVIDRPKGYFPVPALKYLDGPYLDFVRDALEAPEAKARGLFNEETMAGIMADPAQHITPLRGSKLWQMALLEKWLQTHGI
ncbi:MAG: N-acetylglutaminylglutamine amidotransferase [Rhodospirillales bacterium]